MAFRGVLPENPSFGTQLSRGLGQGISSGLGKAADFAEQLGMEKYKKNLRSELIRDIESPQKTKPSDQDFIDSLPQIKQKLGRELTPQDLNELYPKWLDLQGQQASQQPTQQDPFAKAKKYAAAGEHELTRVATEEAKSGLEQKKAEREHEFSREKEMEPKVDALEDLLHTTENTGVQLDALNEIFSQANDDEFPSTIMAGIFTKDGQLNPVFESQLSPTANRAAKIIADQIRGIKSELGSQISGFEVQQWLNRLPKLLMSPEGRREVTRDLRVFNKMNEHFQRGVLDIIDREGGAGKISMSKAKKVYRKENADEINEMRDLYIRPDRKSFNRLPPAWAYPGKRFRDPETGKILISDGNSYQEAK